MTAPPPRATEIRPPRFASLRRYWALAAVAAVAALLQALAPDGLRYEREAILDGQLWRLVTGNLLHLGWTHLALNLAGLLIIGLSFPGAGADRPWRLLADLLLLSLAVGLGLLRGSPDVAWYVGLSGALHGLLVLAAAGEWHRSPRFALTVLIALALKLAWEQWTDAGATAALIGGKVVVDAHLYGALGGALLAPLRYWREGR